MHMHARVAQVDAAGEPVPGSFDCHSHLEGPQLHFQADKNRDQCFDWEAKEEERMKGNETASRTSALKFVLAPFAIVWMHCVILME